MEQLAAPTIWLCLYGHLCKFGIQYNQGRPQSSLFMELPNEKTSLTGDYRWFILFISESLSNQCAVLCRQDGLWMNGRKHFTDTICCLDGLYWWWLWLRLWLEVLSKMFITFLLLYLGRDQLSMLWILSLHPYGIAESSCDCFTYNFPSCHYTMFTFVIEEGWGAVI